MSAVQRAQQPLHGRSYSTLSALVCLSLLVAICLADTQQTDADRKKAVYAMYAIYKKSFQNVADISPLKALALSHQGKVIFVDVRKPEEMKISMLPGAISLATFLSDPSRYTGKTIVGYCTISFRSGKIAKALATEGVTMLNLKGGLLAWTHEGGKVYGPNGETYRLHVFGKKWDLAPVGYTTTTFRWWKRIF
jgi:sodium/bile acid cotransporter 7